MQIDVSALQQKRHVDLLTLLTEFLGGTRYMLLENLNDPLQIKTDTPTLRWNTLGFNDNQNHTAAVLIVEEIAQTLCKFLDEIYLKGKIKAHSPMIHILMSSPPGTRIYNKIEWGPIPNDPTPTRLK